MHSTYFFLHEIPRAYQQGWEEGGTGTHKPVPATLSTWTLAAESVEIIFPFPRSLALIFIRDHSHSFFFWGCVLNVKGILQLSLTETAAAVGIPDQPRAPCCSVEFPDVRSRRATEVVGSKASFLSYHFPWKIRFFFPQDRHGVEETRGSLWFWEVWESRGLSPGSTTWKGWSWMGSQ